MRCREMLSLLREPLLNYYMASSVSGEDESNPITVIGYPRGARWSYFACLGLPTMPAGKTAPKAIIIKPLLTKLVWSRWLDISLVLFYIKKELVQYRAILTSHLINNPYVFTSSREFSKHQFSDLMGSFTKYTASKERCKLS